MGIPLTVQWLGLCCLMEGTTGSLVEELTSSKLHRETKLEKKRKINHLDLIDIQRACLQHLMKTHSFLMNVVLPLR